MIRIYFLPIFVFSNILCQDVDKLNFHTTLTFITFKIILNLAPYETSFQVRFIVDSG